MADNQVDAAKAVGHKYPPQKVAWNKRDLILYALGVGATDLKYTYEGDADFAAFPTYPVVLGLKGDSSDIVPFGSTFGGIPGVSFNPANLVHGEQSLEILKPLPSEGLFTQHSKIAALYDKGKGTLLVTESTLVDSNGSELAVLKSGAYIRGLGGWGGPRGPTNRPPPPPSTPPVTHSFQTSPHQALLYRLSGDYNPLHADPAFSGMVGFEKPILHGLCSFGSAAYGIIKHFADNQPNRLRSISVRFSAPVIPGETLVTEMWKVGNKIVFQVRVKERNVLAVTDGEATLFDGAASTGSSAPAAPAAATAAASLKSQAVFDGLANALKANPDLVKKVGAVFQFNITTPDKQVVSFTVDVKNGAGEVRKGTATSPDCVLTISDTDYFDMSTGKLSSQQAFVSGKLKISGNVVVAQKLSLLQKAASKL